MERKELTQRMISLLDWNCKSTSFNDSLIPENCFCPGIAKATDKENSEYHIRVFYFILSCFTTDIVRGKPDSACIMLGFLKDYLDDYQISLSQFINKEGLFSGTDIYYTLINSETNLCWAICAKGAPGYGYRLLNNISYIDGFYEPEKNRIPEFLQKIEFKCLTKDIVFSEYLYNLFYSNADNESQKLLMQENWDEINYKLLGKYIKNDIKNKKNAVQTEPAAVQNKDPEKTTEIEGKHFIRQQNILDQYFTCTFDELKQCYPEYKNSQEIIRAFQRGTFVLHQIYRIQKSDGSMARKYAIKKDTRYSRDLITKIGTYRRQKK